MMFGLEAVVMAYIFGLVTMAIVCTVAVYLDHENDEDYE